MKSVLDAPLSALAVCSLPPFDGSGGVCEIEGTQGPDVRRGTPSSDVIGGLGGNDTIAQGH